MVNVKQEKLIIHLTDALSKSTCEKEVERAYLYHLEEFFETTAYSGGGLCKTDGILKTKHGTILQECKYYKPGSRMTTRKYLAQIAQAIWYVFEYPKENIKVIISNSNLHFGYIFLEDHPDLIKDMGELYSKFSWEYSPSRVWNCSEIRERMSQEYILHDIHRYSLLNRREAMIMGEYGTPEIIQVTPGIIVYSELEELVDRLGKNE